MDFYPLSFLIPFQTRRKDYSSHPLHTQSRPTSVSENFSTVQKVDRTPSPIRNCLDFISSGYTICRSHSGSRVRPCIGHRYVVVYLQTPFLFKTVFPHPKSNTWSTVQDNNSPVYINYVFHCLTSFSFHS